MSVHVHLRGSLIFADEATAAAAIEQLKSANPSSVVLRGVNTSGATLAVTFKGFVSAEDDIDGTLGLLQELAERAVDGKVLYDEERGRKLQMSPTVRYGGPPRDDDDACPWVAKGSLGFVDADAAKRAYERLAAALVRAPSRGLSRKGAKVSLALDGIAPREVRSDVYRTVEALVCEATQGRVLLRVRGYDTTMRAPLAVVGEPGPEMKRLRVQGSMRFSDEAARDEVIGNLAALHVSASARGKTKTVIDLHAEGRATEATVTTIHEGIAAQRERCTSIDAQVVSAWFHRAKLIR